jgi:hypothetical protein
MGWSLEGLSLICRKAKGSRTRRIDDKQLQDRDGGSEQPFGPSAVLETYNIKHTSNSGEACQRELGNCHGWVKTTMLSVNDTRDSRPTRSFWVRHGSPRFREQVHESTGGVHQALATPITCQTVDGRLESASNQA